MSLEPSFDTWTSLFLVVVLHGIVLAATFFFRKEGRNRPNRLLGTFLFLFSLNLFSYVLYWTHYNLEFPHLNGIAGTFHFLYGPLLFFYALSITKPRRPWKLWDVVHLIPFIIFLIWMTPFFLQSAPEKIALLVDNLNASEESGLSVQTFTVVSIKATIMAGYVAAIFAVFWNAQKSSDNKSNSHSKKTYRWAQLISYSFLGYVISYVTYFVLVETIDFKIEHDYMVSFAMSFFIFGIGYLGFFKPAYLDEAHNGKFKYKNSSLSAEEADAYLEKLLSYMSEDKPYLDGDLKMDTLAKQLSIPSHHLSQIINERLDKNFFEFVNSYRVIEAKQILSDPSKKEFKILRIAFESGFNNKTTFNSVFKDKVGTTPSRFRKEHLNGHI